MFGGGGAGGWFRSVGALDCGGAEGGGGAGFNPLSPTGKGAYVRCTLVPSLPLFRTVPLPLAPSPLASPLAGPEAEVDEEGSCLALDEDDVDFFVCRAEENIPSGTTRSRRYGIESIVFKLPSVDLVK